MMLDDTSPNTLTIQMAARSDMGNVRASNEDNLYYVGRFRDAHEDVSAPYRDSVHYAFDGGLFAVCDGMGGEAYGEEASLIAVSGLSRLEMTLLQEPPAHWDAAMKRYLELANAQICQRIRIHEGQRMGTTLVALFLRGDRAKIINLGDSRAYRWVSSPAVGEEPFPEDANPSPMSQNSRQAGHRAGAKPSKLEQLTIDHTQAQRLADIGIIEPSEVRRHPERHRLLQHLGVFPSEAELKPYSPPSYQARVGEIYLLCSDGLNDSLSEEEMEELFLAYEAHGDLDQLADALMARALEVGGNDNISFLLLRVDELGEPLDYDPEDAAEEEPQENGARHSETRNVTAIDALDLSAHPETKEPPRVFEALEAMETLPEAWLNLSSEPRTLPDYRGPKDQTSEIPPAETFPEGAPVSPYQRPATEEAPPKQDDRSPYARPEGAEDTGDQQPDEEPFFADSPYARERADSDAVDHGETRPLTPSFIEAMRQSTRDLAEGMDELGTIPQINPVRVGAHANSDRSHHDRQDSSTDDTIARNEGERDWVMSESDGRVIAQPITTDDLERFRKAREESLRRQQVYEQEDRERGYNNFTQNDRRLNVYAQMERERAAQNERPGRPENERTVEKRKGGRRRQSAQAPRRGRRPRGFGRYLLDLLLGLLIGFFLCFLALNLGNLF